MKKHIFIFVAFLFVIVISGLIARLWAAEIIYVEGAVQVQSGSGQTWKNAEKGMKVNIGDSIRTARHSLADVALDEEKKNTIRIDPKTLVVLNSATAGSIDRLDLSHGRVTSKLENLKAGLSFEVSTPSAVAGVRGSSYSVYAERDSDEVKAFKDSVLIKAYDADKNLISELTLPEGFKTFIERFEGPGTLVEMTMREFDRFDRTSEEISEHEQGIERARSAREREAQGKPQEETKPGIEQHANQVGNQESIIQEVTTSKERIEEKVNDNIIQKREEELHPPTTEESYHAAE